MTTVCGSDCGTCASYKKECQGCDETKGCIFWASMMGMTICPIYNCAVNEKKYKNCGDCESLPCDMYKNLKDPSMTDEDHMASVDKRVKALKQR